VISGEELAAYAAGEADPAVVARIESVLPEDRSLAVRLAAIRDVDAQLSAWITPDLDEAASDRLLAAVDADLESLARASVGVAAVAADDPSSGVPRSGGVEAAGSRPVVASGWRRFRTRWNDLVDGVGVTQLAGAAAALVVVIGVGAVVNGSMGGTDQASTAEMMDDLVAAEPAPEVAGDAGGGFGSQGTDAGAESEAMSESMDTTGEVSSEPASMTSEEYGIAAASSPPVIDDGRVVADLADIDPAALRERLEPLIDLSAAAVTDGQTAAADAPREAASSEREVLLADGRVAANDLDAVAACRSEVEGDVIVAEVVVLAPAGDAPAGDVILYVQRDRVVVVAVDGCRRLGVRED